MSLESIRRHFYYKRVIETGGHIDYTEYLKDDSSNDTITVQINEMDKQILGFLAQGVKERKIQKYDFNVSDNFLDYFTFIKSDQIDIIATYGDLIYIDGTYNVNNDKFVIINFTVVDKHMKSYIGAVGYVVHENYDTYVRMLKFIKANIPFKRLPMCLICDGALSIHKAVKDVFPYTKHIYCAFHLMRGGNLYPKNSNLSQEKKDEIKKDINTMLTSFSQSVIAETKSKLEYLLNNTSAVDINISKVAELIAHGLNCNRSQQESFTARSVASSRIECENSLIKRNGSIGCTSLINSVKITSSLLQNQVTEYQIIFVPKCLYKMIQYFKIIFTFIQIY